MYYGRSSRRKDTNTFQTTESIPITYSHLFIGATSSGTYTEVIVYPSTTITAVDIQPPPSDAVGIPPGIPVPGEASSDASTTTSSSAPTTTVSVSTIRQKKC
jgi:hypothetical protein